MICNKGTCVLSCFALLCIVVLPSNALLNLAKDKSTSQSSDYDPMTVSYLAVDGCKEQEFFCRKTCNNFKTYCCTHQKVNQTYAWWSVHLEQLSEIAYIFVYFRKYMYYDGHQPFELFRTQGYTIRVSNDTDLQSGGMCFHDTSYDLSDDTRTRNHSSCTNITGRYVHFTNNGVMMNQYNALLELCEVQVYGCPVSTYGNQCSQLCDSSCLGRRCDLYTGKCLACEKGSFIDGTGNCKVCPQNCINCQSNIGCIECSDTYYLVRNGNVCTRCPDYCKICEKNSGCTECNDNYYLWAQACKPCPAYCSNCENNHGCTECIGNYYLKSQVCQPCPPHCSICINGIGCSMCEVGFVLNNSMCIECQRNCLQCATPASCLECKTGYFLERNTCQLCPEFCLYCDEGGKCTKCEDRHYIGVNGKCIECLDTCRNCSAEGCTECKEGYHGASCSEKCGSCKNVVCNQTTGFCLESACKEGYQGDTCKMTLKQKQSGQNLGTYIGGAVGGFIVIVIIVVLTFLIIKKRKTLSERKKLSAKIVKKESPKSSLFHSTHQKENDRSHLYANESSADKQEDTYYNMGPIGVPIARFKHMVQTKLMNEATILKDEFKTYNQSEEYPCDVAKLDRNKDKNRFKQIYAYDHSRVKLKKGDGNDYINANYIDGTDKPKVFIATQGPKTNTIDDFWFMIWQENCGKIVMLTNLKEGVKTKCDQYWPEKGHEEVFPNFSIKLLHERKYGFYIIRTLKVLQKLTKQEREIQQFHFISWPDHGTPNALEIVLFHRRVANYPSKHLGPICVHCSAGVGRSGTYIGFDALFAHGKNTGYIDVPSYLKKMRTNRMLMIQTEEQYIALHEILLEAFSMENTLVKKISFNSFLLEAIQSGELHKEYKNLQSLKPKYDESHFVTAIQHLKKNKTKSSSLDNAGYAADRYRVILQSGGMNVNNYINAIIVPSYRSKTGFIATQLPTPDTNKEFWHMLIAYNCKTIIILAEKAELVLINDIFPQDDEIKMDELIVKTKWDKRNNEIDISVKDVKEKTSTELKVFCNTDWKQNIPVSGSIASILRLAETVESREQTYGNNCSTVIMSSDGSCKTGVFCLLCNTRTQLKMDEEVDVFQAARQLQIRRTTFIDSYEEYEYCYSALQEYLNMTDVYMNT